MLICRNFVFCLLVQVFLVAGLASAEVRLPGVFSDHMVIQQQIEIPIWGWAEANQSVVVTFAGRRQTATANEDGRWDVRFPPLTASSKPVTLVVDGVIDQMVGGTGRIKIKDILIGEVWFCSGQSNMAWTVAKSADSEAEILAAKFPLIRQLEIPQRVSAVPIEDVQAQWKTCSPETVGNFTACGYFMARRLHQELNVPIGLVNCAWGGTRIEPWIPMDGFAGVESLQGIYQSVLDRTPGTPSHRGRLADHIEANKRWMAKAETALKLNQTIEPSPPFPASLVPFDDRQDPTVLYNAMVHAAVGYPIRGLIWYQGEANHAEGMKYADKMKALVTSWRSAWGQSAGGQGDFPVYYVQIAPHRYGKEDASVLPQFWEAQASVQASVTNTAMVVINDIATVDDIHPPNKQDVGLRLANLALSRDYGRSDIAASNPTFSAMRVSGRELTLAFTHTAGGLTTRDGAPPTHFEIIGSGSGGFHPAIATINGDEVTLRADAVANPVAFQFAWHKTAQPNLVGGNGLPVGAFRGGNPPSFMQSLPIADDYALVYDLNLDKLNDVITYDIDHSATIGGFDRIGYLLELADDKGGDQKVFVSMNAFTDDATKIGIPSLQSNARFQQSVTDMDVYSTLPDVATGTGIEGGNIEFWPNSYSPASSKDVKGASNQLHDFGDTPSGPRNGYGSMQVHHPSAGQTVFAINHWKLGVKADIGIGNSSGRSLDWTFAANASTYRSKRLRVYVRLSNE